MRRSKLFIIIFISRSKKQKGVVDPAKAQAITSVNVHKKARQSKKRVRESESAGPTVKKVKLLSHMQDFKKPKKG